MGFHNFGNLADEPCDALFLLNELICFFQSLALFYELNQHWDELHMKLLISCVIIAQKATRSVITHPTVYNAM